MRQLKVPLEEVLDTVACAEDYGFDGVFLMSMAGWTGDVSDGEIEEFCRDIALYGNYEEEDVRGIHERLTEWRDKYCRPAADSKRGE